MRGVALRRQMVQTGEIEPLALRLVEKCAQLLGQADRLIDMALGFACENELRQQELAAQGRQRRRQISPFRQGRSAGFVFVEIAERADARQQHGAGIRLPQKSLAKGATGTPCRQQNRHPAERQGIVLRERDDSTMQQAVDQGIGEGQFGRDGEQAGWRARFAQPPPSRDSRRSVSASASGLPT